MVELNRPLRLIELSLPALKPGQVLVEVAYSGICHSQLNEVRGRKGPDRYLPHTLGHEGSGRVVAVGEGVSKVKAGDRVVLSWIKGRGADVTGTVYDSPEGAINSGAISTLVRQTVTCENRVIAIPGAMPLREAALLGCAVPTGAGIVFNTLRIEAGSSLAVFGVGGIGLSAVLAAVGLGARPIIAVDVVAVKLDMASELGATHVVNAGDIDPVAAVRELTRGEGVDFAIEAAGRAEAMEAAFESV
ncbi:MAG: zinc-binding dehydrogenase, partial [Acidiferrobacterales bacterium]